MAREVYEELIAKFKAEGKDPFRLEKRLKHLNTRLWKRTKSGKPSA